jgi:tryptophanyl-tRNA synthetase
LEIYTRTFAPFREKRLELEANPKMVDEILAAGAEKARAVARKTLDAARVACGLD